MSYEVETLEELESLPDGTKIEDTELIATKRNGAWDYEGIGFFEPENFPVTVLDN